MKVKKSKYVLRCAIDGCSNVTGTMVDTGHGEVFGLMLCEDCMLKLYEALHAFYSKQKPAKK